MKIYITLNESKEKDKVIIDYLDKQYSKSGVVKALLYQVAIGDGNVPLTSLEYNGSKSKQKASKDKVKLSLSEFI